MRTSAIFGAKNFGFFEIYGVFAQTRKVKPVRTFCGQRGWWYSNADVRTFWRKKNFGFFEIYGVSARTRRVEPVRIFCGQKGKGVIFCDFVQTSFMDSP